MATTFLGTFGDNSNRAMTLLSSGSQIYSYGSCLTYALQNSFTYFALQGIGTGPGNAQCLVSNNIVQATQYGTTTNGAGTVSYVTSVDGKVYGQSWSNAIYMITNPCEAKLPQAD